MQTMGMRLLQGRWFRGQDESESSDAVIVDEAAARRFWPGQDPIGKRLCINCEEGRPQLWKQVVGLVSPIHHYSLEAAAGAAVYNAARAMDSAQFLGLRTRGRPTDLAPAVRRMVASLDPNVPVYLSTGMSTLIGDSVSD